MWLLFRSDGILQEVDESSGELIRVMVAGGIGDSAGCLCEEAGRLPDTESEFVNPDARGPACYCREPGQ